jgi:UDP-2,3-diacylglucosamine pyrophosphatase LpxH
MAEIQIERDRISSSEHSLPNADGLDNYDRLKAFVVSDVHLNNHPYDQNRDLENPRRRNFRLFLTRLNTEIQQNDKVILILNGDILDITGSWFEPVMPWDPDHGKVEATLDRLLLEIMENNLSTFQEMRKFLQCPNTEIVYVFGNHDGLLQRFPNSHSVIRSFLSVRPEVQKRIRFAPYFMSEELDFYAEHGHLLDPFNYADSSQPPLGDVINILIVNRFVDLAVTRLRANGYSEEFISRMHAQLHDIEYLRPLALVPVWIQTIGHQFERHPENAGKPQSIKEILISVVSETLQEPRMIQFMIERLHLPKAFLYLLIKITLRIPAILPLISFVTSKVVRRTHSNKYQYKAAQKIYRDKGCRLIAFGHTHIPGVQPLSENAYYFNTGSWKPVINLFKYSKEDLVELEYLNPEVQFNKVERSGILRLEKVNPASKAPAEFSLQTIQSGRS